MRFYWLVILLSVFLCSMQGESNAAQHEFLLTKQLDNEGIILRAPEDEREILWTIPDEVKVNSAKVKLYFKHSLLEEKQASLQVRFDDRSEKNYFLNQKDGQGYLELDVPATELAKGEVKLTIRFRNFMDKKERCVDENINSGFVTLEAATALIIDYEEKSAKSVKTALAFLSGNVNVLVPDGTLSEKNFLSAFFLTTALKEIGYNVRIHALPSNQEIDKFSPEDRALLESVASGAEQKLALPKRNVMRWLASLLSNDVHWSSALSSYILVGDKPAIETAKNLQKMLSSLVASIPKLKGSSQIQEVHNALNIPVAADQNIAVFMIRGQPFIIANSEQPQALAKAVQHWQSALVGDAIFVASAKRPQDEINRNLVVQFQDLSIKNETRSIGLSNNWDYNFSIKDMPQSGVPANLTLKATISDFPEKNPAVLNVFLNDALIYSQKLSQENTPTQNFTMDFDREHLQTQNRLRVTLNRQPIRGECSMPLTTYVAQILNSSEMLTKRTSGKPENFLEVPNYLAKGFALFLPKYFLDTPEIAIDYLSEIASSLIPIHMMKEAFFVGKSLDVKIGSPFVFVGALPSKSVRAAPLYMDRGNINIVTPDGRTILDAYPQDLSGHVIEIAHIGSYAGLWIPIEGKPKLFRPSGLSLGNHNLAFFSQGGVSLSLNTKRADVGEIYYPEVKQWVEWFAQYRLAFIVIFWILLTFFVIYLWRKTKEQKRLNKDHNHHEHK